MLGGDDGVETGVSKPERPDVDVVMMTRWISVGKGVE